jgi:uncharacterized protein (TIGR03085 family)
MPWVQWERRSLASTFATTDPEQPTLCDGWTVRHLLAHLVQREHQPLDRLADQLSRSEPGHEKRLGKLVDSARTPQGYEALLARFAAGPSRLSPWAWTDEAVNFLEYVIHHEDVRRGGPPLPARTLPAKEQDAIWSRLRTLARLGFRRAPVGVTLALPSGQRQQVHHHGEDGVVLTGDPVELLLYASGRREAADVGLTGAPEPLERFRTWAGAR